jgi:SET domain-containing protein
MQYQADYRLITVSLNNIFFRDLFVLLIETELRNSEIHGIGLFCREAIPKGTKVWAFNPLVDLVLDESAIWSLPKPVINFMRMYAYRARETRELIVNVDLARHMNHADSPTLVCDSDSNYYTAEDLPSGTELTCDYREFAVEGCSDFLDNQQQAYSHATAESQIFAVAAEG